MFEVRQNDKTISYHNTISDANEAASFMSKMEKKKFDVYNPTGVLIKSFKE